MWFLQAEHRGWVMLNGGGQGVYANQAFGQVHAANGNRLTFSPSLALQQDDESNVSYVVHHESMYVSVVSSIFAALSCF